MIINVIGPYIVDTKVIGGKVKIVNKVKLDSSANQYLPILLIT